MPGTITPLGVGVAATGIRFTNAAGLVYDPGTLPGTANVPIIFEPPAPLTAGTTELWILATGASKNWGGAGVYVSSTGSTYTFVGTVYRGGRQGYTTAYLPAAADPDLGDVLSVDLTESAGELLSGTRSDADSNVTLCYLDGELISYQTATLTATNKYDLSYLRRGAYGTTINSHSAGAKFARFGPTDGSIYKYRFPANFVGSVIYVKLCSFNLTGSEIENLADVTAYGYSLVGHGLVGGTGLTPTPPAPALPRLLRPGMAAAINDNDDPPFEVYLRRRRFR